MKFLPVIEFLLHCIVNDNIATIFRSKRKCDMAFYNRCHTSHIVECWNLPANKLDAIYKGNHWYRILPTQACTRLYMVAMRDDTVDSPAEATFFCRAGGRDTAAGLYNGHDAWTLVRLPNHFDERTAVEVTIPIAELETLYLIHQYSQFWRLRALQLYNALLPLAPEIASMRLRQSHVEGSADGLIFQKLFQLCLTHGIAQEMNAQLVELSKK